MLARTLSTEARPKRASPRQRASGKDYDGAFERRREKELYFALDRHGDDNVGALTDSIAYVSRKDAERHLQILRRSLRRSRPSGSLVLEAGSGTGGYLRWITARLPGAAIGFDASCVAIAAAAERTADRDKVLFFVGDVQAIPLRKGLAGGALALDLLHLIADRRAALRGLHDALAPLATLVFTVLHPERDSANELAAWEKELKDASYAVAAVRDVSAPWREHMVAKHSRRWERRQRFRNRLGAWIEPELQVTAAMLGLDGGQAAAWETGRYEFEVVRQ